MLLIFSLFGKVGLSSSHDLLGMDFGGMEKSVVPNLLKSVVALNGYEDEARSVSQSSWPI